MNFGIEPFSPMPFQKPNEPYSLFLATVMFVSRFFPFPLHLCFQFLFQLLFIYRTCKIVPLCWNCYDNHDAIECETLKRLQLPATFLIDNFDVVTPFRVLLLFYRYAIERNVNSTVASDLKIQIDEVLSMESHCTERRDTWIWQQHAKNVIQPLRDINIDAIFEAVQAPCNLTDDFLQKICGALDVNTFEVRTQYFEV